MSNPIKSTLNRFVDMKTGPAPHPKQQPTNITRQLAGAKAKVSVPATRTNSGHNRQVAAAVPTPGHGQQSDTFGTEYAGSTVSDASVVLVGDSQVNHNGKHIAKSNRDNLRQEEYDEDSEGSSESEDSGDEYEEEGEENQDPMSLKVGEGMLQQQQQRDQHLIDASIGSYPTTTSGRMDEELENEDLLQRAFELELPVHANHYAREQQQPARHFHPVHELRPLQQQQQQQQRQNTAHLLRPEMQKQPAQARLRQLPQQARDYPLVHRQSPPAPIKRDLVQDAPKGGLRWTTFVPQQFHRQQVPVANLAPSTAGPAPTKSTSESKRMGPYAPVQPEYEAPENPTLDYEPAQVVKMSYDELRSQSYDVDPSPEGTVIRGNIGLDKSELSKPLPDRLNLVQKLTLDNQIAFFASIPLDEWEDAGDWFLERFGEVVKKMGEARKEKRKLTQAFESEIYKRHEDVDNKKRDIDDALVEMRNSGDRVLQFGSTPKRQKTPASTIGGQ